MMSREKLPPTDFRPPRVSVRCSIKPFSNQCCFTCSKTWTLMDYLVNHFEGFYFPACYGARGRIT